MLTIEDYIEQTGRCHTVAELGKLFLQAIQEEGFENLSFCRVQNKRTTSSPWLIFPDGFVSTYYDNAMYRHDPFLSRVPRASGPMYWDDIELHGQLLKSEREMLGRSRECGVHSGLSIPFHGPDGHCDIIGLSLRRNDRPDRSRTGIIQAKTTHTRWRYWQIVQEQRQRANTFSQDSELIHAGGPKGMTSRHCRALVFVDVAARRWDMGFVDLNRDILRYVRVSDLEALLKWGLVTERADDDRFRFYFAPSVLGVCHMGGCEQVASHRRDIWEMDIARSEIPQL